MKSPEERFADAIAELNRLKDEGYDISGLRPMSLSATGKTAAARPVAPVEKPASGLRMSMKKEDDA